MQMDLESKTVALSLALFAVMSTDIHCVFLSE